MMNEPIKGETCNACDNRPDNWLCNTFLCVLKVLEECLRLCIDRLQHTETYGVKYSVEN